MASNVVEFGSLTAKYRKSAFLAYWIPLTKQLPLIDEELEDIKKKATVMIESRIIHKMIAEDISSLKQQEENKRWSLFFDLCKSRPSYIHIVWEYVMTLTPVRNTNKEKVFKLKGHIKEHFHKNTMDHFKLVPDKYQVKRFESGRRMTQLLEENDLIVDEALTTSDNKSFLKSISGEIIQTLKVTGLFQPGLEEKSIPVLLAHLKSSMMSKMEALDESHDRNTDLQDSLSERDVSIQQLQDMNTNLREKLKQIREDRQATIDSVKAAVAEEIQGMMECQAREMREFKEKQAELAMSMKKMSEDTALHNTEVLRRLDKVAILQATPSLSNMSIKSGSSKSSNSGIYPIQESEMPGNTLETGHDPSGTSSYHDLQGSHLD